MMASKKLGKFRQWATEAISSKDKTIVTEEFRELEHDIDLRREGIQRLAIASEDFFHATTKKRESTATNETDKLLAVDALGIVMITHGEEFGEESAYGSSLVAFGRAKCKIATLQEAFGLTFRDSYLKAMNRYQDEINDYHLQRKKLESRRLSLDAAMTKLEGVKKNKKVKEKELAEAEDELARAKQRYEETSTDIRARMYAIQENEMNQLRDLTGFLDLELNFYQQMVEVLKDVKYGWHDEEDVSRVERARPSGPTHSFARTLDDVDAGSVRSKDKDKMGSVRSQRSSSNAKAPKLRAKRSGQHLSSDNDSDHDHGEQDEEGRRTRTSSFSISGRRGSMRKRTDSTATAGSAGAGKDDHEKDKGSKRSMFGSIAWGGKSSAKNKEQFAALRGSEDAQDDSDGEYHRPPSALSNRSGKSTRSKGGKSPRISAAKMFRAGSREPKRALALHDYVRAGEDELSFQQGDEVVVLNEVSDDWWLGELNGKSGLFPTSYVRVAPTGGKKPPVLPRRQNGTRPAPFEDDTGGYAGDTSRFDSGAGVGESEGEQTTDFEDPDHPFGDHMLVESRTPVYANFDARSVESSAAEESGDEEAGLPLSQQAAIAGVTDERRRAPPPAVPKMPSRNTSSNGSPSSTFLAAPKLAPAIVAKKTPPPPPPPRRASSAALTPAHSSSSTLSMSGSNVSHTPPLPPRSVPPSISRATSGLGPSISRTPKIAAASPFGADSPTTDFSAGAGGCQEFQQHPFKEQGMCANCFGMHAPRA